jgi:hypothetical protein
LGFPDFLVIGSQRSGTTWLYNVLETHKQIALAKGRKEVHYFDRYYERGFDWYKKLYPDNFSGKRGEITPAYLYHKECAYRIKQDLPNAKLICILRNPIERAYSGYKFMIQEKELEISFEKAIKEFPDILERGLYFQQLERYSNYFENNQMKVVFFDDLIKNPEKLVNFICDYLEISYEYDKNILSIQFNKSCIPKYPFIYKFAKKIVRKMYDYDKVNVLNWLKEKNIKYSFFKEVNNDNQRKSGVRRELLNKIKEYYRVDVKKLSDLLGIDLNSLWKI